MNTYVWIKKNIYIYIYIYQHADKCDDQQKFKDIIKAAIKYTPVEITDDSPSLPKPQTIIKKPSARKSPRLFTNTFYVKNRTAIYRFWATK